MTDDDDFAVPDGASPLYAGSSITKGQLFTLVFAFLLHHCCTEVAAADLLLLLNTVIPGCMPHNLYFFKKLLQPGVAGNIDMHAVCSKCGEYLCMVTNGILSYICPECNCSLNIKDLINNGNTFLTYSLEKQLRTLFEKIKIGNSLARQTDSSADSLNDIHDGSEYQKMNCKFPESISLTCNTDGIPAFASSNTSLWPIYLIINELPLALRRVHMLLSSLWIGPSKPRLDSFFKPVVQSLEKLYDEAFEWVCGGRLIRTTVHMCVVSCDSVARPLLQNLKQFNGEYGCGFCFNSGTVVQKGLGNVRCYAELHHKSVPMNR